MEISEKKQSPQDLGKATGAPAAKKTRSNGNGRVKGWWRRTFKKTKRARPGRFARTYTSLYLDDSGIRLLVVKGKYVIKWAELPLEPGLVEGGVVANPLVVGAKIRAFLRQHRTGSRKVIMGFSGLHCLSRIITLPVLSRNLLSEAIWLEAGREMPVSRDLHYLVWQVVQVTRDEMKAFVIAYSRNIADSLIETMRVAGIKPSLVDLAPLAITRALSTNTAAAVDIEPSHVDIVIMVKGVPQLIRSLPLPRLQSLQDKLPVIRQEIERSLKFYDSTELEKLPEGRLPVFVSGELADARFSDGFTGDLGYAVQWPAPQLHYPEQMTPAPYMVNIGLTLKRLVNGNAGVSLVNINALPEIYLPRHTWLNRIAAATACLVGIAVLAYSGLLVRDTVALTASMRSELASANQQLVERQALMRPQSEAVAGLETQVAGSDLTYANLQTALDSFAAQHIQADYDFYLATAYMPPRLTLAGITYSPNELVLKGTSPGEAEVSTYARSLAGSGRYSQVVITELDASRGDTIFTLVLRR
ncbi:MAG: pilus assembly protein PilM [Chloroflexi bacterium]|nr:pilus assembly protein PilM [Chloroflexota bacterium]